MENALRQLRARAITALTRHWSRPRESDQQLLGRLSYEALADFARETGNALAASGGRRRDKLRQLYQDIADENARRLTGRKL